MASCSLSFQRLPVVSNKRFRWLDDGFMPPRSPKSLVASRGVQWSRTRRARCAAGFSAIVDRRERVLARPEDRTEQRGSSASAQPEPCRPPGRPSRPGVLAPPGTAQRPASPTRPQNRRTRPSRLAPSLTKVANAPNALAVAAPFSTMDAKVRTASAATGENLERDKPFEDCDTGMGMMLWVRANILPRGQEHSFLPPDRAKIHARNGVLSRNCRFRPRSASART